MTNVLIGLWLLLIILIAAAFLAYYFFPAAFPVLRFALPWSRNVT
jgi:hypothetical protein